MSRILDQLSNLPLEEKRALLAKLLLQEGTRAPLSFGQERIWFLTALEPNNPFYNVPVARRLNGELDVAALERAFAEIVRRHDSLRTRFESEDGVPWQVIDEPGQWNLKIVDLSDREPREREAEAKRLELEEAQRPFALEREWGIRAQLLRLSETEHVLLLTMHHIVSDGWSLRVLSRELSTLYEAFSTSRPSPLTELPIQYADFACWQRESLQDSVLKEEIDYWSRQLADAPAILELPTDRPRPKIATFAGSYHSRLLSIQLTKSLNELSQREGATLFMTLLTAFQTLLFRYTGQEDIVVGTPIAGRNRVEIENLIGFFVNTLALRTNLSGNPTFKQMLERVKEVTLGAYAHQNLPFERLVEELNPERDLGHSPVFQVMFGMQNAPGDSLILGDLTISNLAVSRETAKFDLTLNVSETGRGLNCWLEYNTDLFDGDTISRMLGHFETLLEGIVRHPESSIAQLPLLTETEQTQLITEWNNTQTDFPKEQTIHQIFEQQVEHCPNSIALELEGLKLSYIELNHRANQLANYLRSLGVGPDSIVALCVERSAEMFIGILGILKVGAAYLPLDPASPRDRLTFMIQDGKVAILLAQVHLQSILPAHVANTIFLDRDWKDIARERTDNPVAGANADSLAYVMYTSGSTGKPKGVAVTHRSVVRLVQDTTYARFGPDHTFLQFAPLSFDASTFEIWGSLLNGGRLVVMQPGLVSLEKLGEAIMGHGVTTLWLTAGLFHQMIETQLPNLRGLRQLIAGGNVLSVPHVEQGVRELQECQLINGYGPTENTTFTCCYAIKAGEQFNGSVPIGFPISNTQVYILDDHMQPVPVGVVGELYTAGAGLALGYLNDAALTSEKFLPHPFSSEPGSRLYRTGDRARYRVDGSVEFLGRLDQQIKLRGYRIELGEIETVIREHPAVRDTVVTVGQFADGSNYLVGYVVADTNHPEFYNKVIASELKGFLKKSLPDYMVPAYFMPIEKLPLTVSGKIDRRGLPSLDGSRPELEEVQIAPRDDLERRLTHIWEKVLGVVPIGIRDNFFDLGGHSLLAVRLVAEIEKETGQRLPLVSFFQGANIENLADLLRRDVRSLVWPTLIEIQKGNGSVPLFCVSHPNVNALGYRSLARHLGQDQSVFGLQAQYPEDLVGEYSQAAVEKMATEYLKSLREVRPVGPYQFVGVCRGAHVAFEMARRLEQEGEQVGLLGILDTWVGENTYGIFFYINHYADRLRSLSQTSLANQLTLLRRKAKNSLKNLGSKVLTVENGAKPKRNPLHEVYFPGPNFVPRTYNGRITVFRVRRQPRDRIREASLGWSRLALGGVNVHVIPGNHSTVLKEPYVQTLAIELKKYLQGPSQVPRLNSDSDSDIVG